ncbi:DXD sugar-binding motif protein [uncultured virus]|nr:DXD sugar-binding motif protein [uncultured virus]
MNTNSITYLIIIIITTILLFYFIYFYKKYKKNEYYTNKNAEIGIPKIIHHIAPADKSKWNRKWIDCFPSWLEKFPRPEYQHIMWNDEEDLRNFIKNNYNWFLPIFDSHNRKIIKIDFAKYFILHKYGGIYADMDMKCFKNFYKLLPNDKISIVESPYKHNENLQNSLMITPKNHPFWLEVIKNSSNRKHMISVLDISGPRLIDDTVSKTKYKINILPEKFYNPKIEILPNESIYTKHYYSTHW